MSIPQDRRYTKTHEWFRVDGEHVVMGITQFAADELTDITYVDLPAVGKKVKAGGVVTEIESVKATSEVFSAVEGEIVDVNQALADHPELINQDAFGAGWIVKLKAASRAPLEELLDAAGYQQALEAH